MSDLANPLAGQKAPGGVGRVPNLPLAQVDTPAAPRPAQTIEDIIGEAPQQGKSIEDILGPPPDVQRQQTVEAGGLPPSGLHWDEYVKQAPMGRVLDAFGHGAAQGWGTGDLGWSDEVTSALRKAGIYPDAETGQSGLVKAFNEAILRPIAGPLATAAEAAVRATGALFGGYQAATEQIGEEMGAHPSIPLGLGNFPQMGRELAAMPEAFFGMPNSLRTPTLPEARSLNVIGSGEGAYFGTAEPKPIPETLTADAVRQMQDAAANKPGEVPYGHAPGALGPAQEAAPPGGYSPSQIPPADIHEAARRVAPLAFADYDSLGATRDALRAQIVDAQAGLRRQAEAQAPGAAEIADLRDRLQDTTPRLAKKYEARLADLLPAHDEFLRDEFTMAALTRDTPEIAALRQDLQRTDYQMRDLAPQVSAAYREVAPQFAAPEAPAVAAPSPALAAAEAAPPEAAPEAPQAVVTPVAPEPIPAPVAAVQPAVAPAAEPVVPGAPRVVPDIATDVAQKLVAAGRPEEEANAAAQLVAAHYDARAQRFQGALGTAQELYAAEAPEIRAGRERAREMAQPGGRELEQRDPNRVPLYSAVSRATDALKQERGTGEQMLAQIQKTAGVRAEEIKWMGLDEWLKGQRSVTKQEIQDYVEANSLDVQEVTRGEGQPPRYAHYQLPGGENYRELLITLPHDTAAETASRQARLAELMDHERTLRSQRAFTSDPGVQADFDRQIRNNYMQMELVRNEPSGRGAYKSAHWDEPNVLAHVRFNDRVAPDGKRTLLVEEVQSDWHQAGRKRGYQSEAPASRFTIIDNNGHQRGDFATEREALEFRRNPPPAMAGLIGNTNPIRSVGGIPKGVPDAPFKTSWPQLAMKRIIKYAVDNGYDRVAWTPGDVQAERYDLSRQVSGISWSPKTGDLYVRKPGSTQYEQMQRGVAQDKLPDIIGKDASEKLLASKPAADNKMHEIEGADLKAGGGGQRAFYDKILPTEVQKIAGKYGAKVGKSEVATVRANAAAAQPVHSLDITPTMREAVDKEGLPLFQGARGKIRLDDGRAVITLMRNANASTFIHEIGHAWLEELLGDAADERAPDDLIGDAKTVRDWLGAKEDEAVTTAQHEKFARGFERYMMEGVAPSRALDSVFAKFRDWLTKIYQTVSRLRAPISDDIRDVFDRLLSTNPEPTTVAPEAPEAFRGEPEPAPMSAERPTIRTVEEIVAQDGVNAARAKRIQEREIVARAEWRPPTAPAVESSAKVAADLADIHEEDAAHTEPERAAEVADTIKAETDETIKTHAPEVANELLGQRPTDETGRGATEATGAPGAGAGTGGGAAEEPVPEPRPISGSGGQAAGEGARGAGTTAEPGSPTEPFRPTESELVDKAGNIRLDNLNQPEDVNQAIREAAAENDDFIHARRGVISDSQVLELADALGMKASDLDRRKLGDAFNAEQVMAARRLLITSATNVRDAMAKAAEGTDADVLAYGEAKSRHRMIQEQVSGITAEAGRALRAFRSIGGAEGADAEFIGNFLRDATGRTLFQLRLEARKGAALETAQQVSKFLNDVDKPGLFDWMQSVFINALLSGPFTHAGYTAAGEMFGLFRAVGETGISAGVGAVRRAFGLGEEEYAHIGEVPAQLYGMYRGARNGSKAAWQALKSGQTVLPEEVTGNLALSKGRAVTSLNIIPNPTISGARIPIGNVLESPSRLVAALHSFNWTTFYSQSISGQAFRTAMEERLQGQAFADRVAELTTSPTPQMIEIGSDDAYNAALMKRPSYDSMMGSISRLTNWGVKVPDIPLPGGNTFPMGTLRPLKYIDPFVQIQSNVIKTAFGRGTPLALFSPEVRADLSMRNGGVAFDRAAGRILAGTGFMVAAGSLAAEGLLNHSAPSDPNQSRAWQRINGLPHGLTIGGTSYDMLRLGNLGLQMSVAADLYHVSTMISTEDASKVAAELVHAFSQNILDESFMRGPAAIMQAAEDENRYGAAWVRNFVSSTVPFSVGMAQVAREIDPYSRQARTTMDAILAKIPVASEQLQPRYDVWGQPVTNRSWDVTYNEAIKNDPTDRVLYGLGIYPSLAPRTIRGVRLSDAQYSDFARTSGRLAKMRLDAMVNTAGFAAIPKGEQVKVINGIIESSRETARATVMMQSYGTPNDIVKQAANNKLRQLHEGKVGAQ